jgi:hypothetical protein
MMVVRIPILCLGDSGSAEAAPYPFGYSFGLGFENFDGGRVSRANRLLRRDVQNERRAARRPKIDERISHLGVRGDAADHPWRSRHRSPAQEDGSAYPVCSTTTTAVRRMPRRQQEKRGRQRARKKNRNG